MTEAQYLQLIYAPGNTDLMSLPLEWRPINPNGRTIGDLAAQLLANQRYMGALQVVQDLCLEALGDYTPEYPHGEPLSISAGDGVGGTALATMEREAAQSVALDIIYRSRVGNENLGRLGAHAGVAHQQRIEQESNNDNE
jgi:hypothetical protein